MGTKKFTPPVKSALTLMLLFIALLLPQVGWAQTEPTVSVGENTIQVGAVSGGESEITGYNLYKFTAPKSGILVVESIDCVSVYGTLWDENKDNLLVNKLSFGDGAFRYESVKAGSTYYIGARTSKGDALDENHKILISIIPSLEEMGLRGNGTADNPFKIYSAEDLANLSDYVYTGKTNSHAVLMNDIDLSSVCHAASSDGKLNEVSWTPIGKTRACKYQGTFDGNGYTIKNLYIKTSNVASAFFGFVKDATIKNLTFENAYVDNTYYSGTAVFAGDVASSTIQNIKTLPGCFVKGSSTVGGIIGEVSGTSLISNCLNSATIEGGGSGVGGLIGRMGWESPISVTFCFNYATITSPSHWVGGLIGYATYGGIVQNSANFGDINAQSWAGNFCGFAQNVTFKNVFCSGNISCTSYGAYILYDTNKDYKNNAEGIIAYSNDITLTENGNVLEGENKKLYGDGTLTFPDGKTLDDIVKGFTPEQIKSGEVAYLLNGSTSTPAEGESLAWYQEIGKDDYPVLTATCFNTVSKNANGDYVNIPNHEPNADGICAQCGNYVSAPPTQGDGTAASPYQIEKPCHLSWLRDQVNAGNKDICATLTNDIDLTNYCHKAGNGKAELSWEPIGKDDANLWRGTFDGNGHTISNLYVHNSQSYTGLFGRVTNSSINNVIVEGEVDGQYYTGGLIGKANGTNITHCETRIIVKGVRFVGGVCGVFETNGNTIANCINKGSVTSTDRSPGGIVGSLSSGNVQDCANYADIEGTFNVGGIIGWASSGTLKNVFNYSNVKATDNTKRVGLIIGGTNSGLNLSGVLAYYDGAKRISNNAELTLEAIGSGTPGGTYSKQSYSVEALASGEATYALNGSTSTSSVNWYQKIGTDAYPLLTSKGGDIVYHGTECNKTTDVYTNDNSIFGEDGAIPHNMVETAETNGLYCELCTKCHAEKEEGIHYIKDFCGINDNNLKLSLQSDNTYKAVDSKVTITDKDAYNSPVDFTADELDYTREYLGNDMWQAVYVPFDMDATDWTNNGITAASINNFHEYELEDGSYETVLEVKKATSGSLSAHMPYVIRSAEDGSKTITIRNAQLHKATSQTIDCQSVTRKYEFTGIYTPQSGFNADGSSSLVYVLNKQGTMATLSNSATLGAQRWYLAITDRHASSASQAAMARDIRIKMIGEGTATGINDLRVITSQGSHATQSGIYDLQGRKMNVAPTHGIYIKNGKKYVK